jgi:molybdopterin converting factor small subunit
MMFITVRFYGLWNLYLGLDRLSLGADSLDDILTQVEARFGSQLRKKLETRGVKMDGKIQDNSIILLNGINIRNLKQAQLREGDILHIFPLVFGG